MDPLEEVTEWSKLEPNLHSHTNTHTHTHLHRLSRTTSYHMSSPILSFYMKIISLLPTHSHSPAQVRPFSLSLYVRLSYTHTRTSIHPARMRCRLVPQNYDFIQMSSIQLFLVLIVRNFFEAKKRFHEKVIRENSWSLKLKLKLHKKLFFAITMTVQQIEARRGGG